MRFTLQLLGCIALVCVVLCHALPGRHDNHERLRKALRDPVDFRQDYSDSWDSNSNDTSSNESDYKRIDLKVANNNRRFWWHHSSSSEESNESNNRRRSSTTSTTTTTTTKTTAAVGK
ncbi:hypothetical protein OTU49_004497 [Cherax quadricarinatus]|uniref:Uncharacterized protein n=1 Tax=Cherax quadricarinatus TaxID=27406 RepID=A0AAW0XCZ5_CHEQU